MKMTGRGQPHDPVDERHHDAVELPDDAHGGAGRAAGERQRHAGRQREEDHWQDLGACHGQKQIARHQPLLAGLRVADQQAFERRKIGSA